MYVLLGFFISDGNRRACIKTIVLIQIFRTVVNGKHLGTLIVFHDFLPSFHLLVAPGNTVGAAEFVASRGNRFLGP